MLDAFIEATRTLKTDHLSLRCDGLRLILPAATTAEAFCQRSMGSIKAPSHHAIRCVAEKSRWVSRG